MPSRLPVVFILITVMIDSMGIGLILPVTPDLIREVGNLGLSSAAVWGGILSTAFALMQFLFGPTVGSLSDRYGRRPVLLSALVIMALYYVVMGLAQTLWLLVVGRIIGGISSATQSTASAYMADISKPDEKAANFGLIGAAFGMGFVLGPLMGGLLAEFGTRAPFYAAAVLAATNCVFGYFVLPETVTDRIRRPFSLKRANPFGAFRHIAALPGLSRLLLVVFIYAIAFFVYPGVWAYFGAERFDWSPRMIGISLALFGISIAVVQGLLIKPIIARIGDRNAVLLGLGVDVGTFFFLAFVTNGWLALALTPLTAVGSIAGPALQGIMSRTAADNQQGELQGVLSSINAVATIIAPLVLTQVFWYFTAPTTPFYMPGAPFLVSAILAAICIVLFLSSPRQTGRNADNALPHPHPHPHPDQNSRKNAMPTIKAAVCREFGAPLTVEDLHLRAPAMGEVEVTLKACAICHSDISYADGAWGGTLPAVYGHEAAGHVTAVGDGVRGLATGDTVVVTLIRSCGTCPSCAGGDPVICETPNAAQSPLTDTSGALVVQAMNSGAFAERVVVDQSQIVKIPADMDLVAASLLACGVITGVGSVVNAARIRAGQDVVVIGAGGVGLNAIQGARIAGARRIVAVDMSQEKLQIARDFGATDGVLATDDKPWRAAKKAMGRGADAVIVTVGAIPAYDSAPQYLANGGQVIMVGMPHIDGVSTYSPVMMAAVNQGMRGSKMGDTVIQRDIPWMVDLYQQGRLELDNLVSARWSLDRINDAIADTKTGSAKRNVIVFD